MDFSESPTDPPGGGGWTLDFSESPTDPLGGGGWTLDFKKERNQVQGGGGLQSDARIEHFGARLNQSFLVSAAVAVAFYQTLGG